jgi:hypothetical protein
MTRDPSTIPEVAKTPFFSQLPATSASLSDQCLECVQLLFTQSPQSITKQLTPVLGALFQLRPVETLILYQPFVRAFPSLTNVWEVADVLLQQKSVIVDAAHGYLLLALITQLMLTSPDYVRQRGAFVLEVFQAMLASPVAANVVSALHALALFSRLKPAYGAAEFAPLLSLLRTGAYARPAVSLIARLHDFPVTDELVRALLVRGKETPVAVQVLLRVACVAAGRAAVLKYRRDLYEIAAAAPAWAFKLFLLVFDADAFSTDPDFPAFLRALVRTREPVVLAGLDRVFARLSIDPELVYELGDVRFFSTYAECAGDAAAVFLDVYARAADVAWCEDIAACLDALLAWVGREELRERIFNALIAVGKYACVAYALRKSALIGILKGVRADPRFGPLAERVIAVVG